MFAQADSVSSSTTDAPAAVRDAEEALQLRREAPATRGSPILLDDDYLRSPLAAFHARLAEAYAAAGKPEDAERESARARALR